MWYQDPVMFVREALSVTKMEKFQEEALKALIGNDKLSIRSGHGVGKTTLLAWIILWWMLTRLPNRIPVTAPTSTQLNDVLWAELFKWHQELPEGLKDLLNYKKDSMTFAPAEKSAFAVARTARREQPEAFQGFHEKNMLFIVDEASGVDNKIFEVGEGSMSTEGAKTVMTGNPTRTTGYFYDSHHKMREQWYCMKVSCHDSSRVTKRYIDDMGKKYGKDSNIYKVRVLGEFPSEDDDAVIPLHLIEDAVDRDVRPSGDIVWGLDVARQGGDRCALAKRQGNTLLEKIENWRADDLMVTAGRVKHMYDETPSAERPKQIFVDVIGMGYGVLDRLRGLGLPVTGVNVAEAPAIGHTYNRFRDELWFKAREWFMARACSIPNDEQLIAELTLPKYFYTHNGKLRVSSKDDMKAKGLQSPDLADAFNLTFAMISDSMYQGEIKYPNLGVV